MGYESFVNLDIDIDKLRKTSNEDDFLAASVELSNEVKQNIWLLLFIKEGDYQGDTPKLTRNQAIIYGLMMRSIKIFQSYMELICANRGETAKILLRSFLETLINIQYLIQQDSEELFDDYIKYSLKTEKKLYESINSNIKTRGQEIPIEVRMLRSVMNSFEASGFSPEDIDANADYRDNKWGQINLKKKCTELFSKEMYQYLFEAIHHFVHGNWQSLLTDDLRYDKADQMFELMHKHSKPRPQHILYSIILYCEAAKAHIEYSI